MYGYQWKSFCRVCAFRFRENNGCNANPPKIQKQVSWNRFLCGQPYVNHMLTMLKLPVEKPPQGWMKCLFKGLLKADEDDKRLPLLILDELKCPPNEEQPNSLLLAAVKNYVKNSGLHAVVLTPNEACANHLCGLNQLVAIGPMEHVYSVPRIFPNGHRLRMQFTVPMLRIACMNNPRLLQSAENKKGEIGARFDTLVQTNEAEYVASLRPAEVVELLLRAFAEERDTLYLALSGATTGTVNEESGCGTALHDSCAIS
jgi:hypothetical protein